MSTSDALEDLLQGNEGAQGLLQIVKSFYGPSLSMHRLRPGETTSRFSLAPSGNSITASVSVAPTERAASAFVHELLHLALRAWGFPYVATFDGTGLSPLQKQIGLIEAVEVRNAIDHEAFRPRYLALGYPANEFLSPGGHDTDLVNLDWASKLEDAADNQTTRRMVIGGAYFRISSAAEHGNDQAADVLPQVLAIGNRSVADFGSIVETVGAWRESGAALEAVTFQETTGTLLKILGLPPALDFLGLSARS